MTRQYRTAAAFKQALEQRIRSASTSGVDFARRRQLVVFDRFLARVALELGEAVTLKGGLAIELRLERARTTKDVDLQLMGSPEEVLERLRAACRRNLGDFMVFTVQPDDRHPDIQSPAMKSDGLRFGAECTVAGKIYGRRFGVDVGFGDPIIGEPEHLVAEKLHAYTMPRPRPNSRVKDLPDMALIATAGPVEASRLLAAVEQTFAHRDTHGVPARLPPPLASWEASYAALLKADHLRWPTLGDAFEAARAFLDPVLAGTSARRWDPGAWAWT